MLNVCPPSNSEGLFEADSDSWAVAKLYTRHGSLEGVQFREQMEIDDMALVVRELADGFYEEYTGEGAPRKALPKPTPWERGQTESRTSDDGENHSLYDFE